MISVKEKSSPPIAPVRRTSRTVHGVELVDDYGWFREKEDPEVFAYLEAENAYSDDYMLPTAELRSTIYDEMLARIKQTDEGAPYRREDYLWYSRTEEGKQYPIFARRRDDADTVEEIVLDLNVIAIGHPFCSLGLYEVSDDGNLLAYSIDLTGFREYTLHVKDLRSGAMLPEAIAFVDAVAWSSDGTQLFYVTEDDAKRPDRLFLHRLGRTDDLLLYQESDELYRLHVEKSLSRNLVVVTSSSSTTSEVRLADPRQPELPLRLFLEREEGHEYYVDDGVDTLVVLTNHDAKDFRVVTANEGESRASWREVIPHRLGVKIEGIMLFERFIVAMERTEGLAQFRIVDRETNAQRLIDFPEPAHEAFADFHFEYRSTKFRYRYQSFITPPSTFEYDMVNGTSELLKVTEVLGGYDRSKYMVERGYAAAHDGTQIPLSILRRADLPAGEPQPLLLYGYGSYGITIGATFSSNRFSLVDRGVTWVVAHIRGGGEMGEEWHDQGKMSEKKNTFTDFIEAAEHLIAKRYTTSDRLAMMGGSAGGLLMGAVMNMRPDLPRAVMALVPFVDVMNTMLDPTLPLTIGEYLEWGNPNVKKEFEDILSYDPYTNIGSHDYPAMLVRTSFNDSQVMYWEAAKYVAKLRVNKTNDRPLLLKTNMGGGHGGSSGRYDQLREIAYEYAFVLRELVAASS